MQTKKNVTMEEKKVTGIRQMKFKDNFNGAFFFLYYQQR